MEHFDFGVSMALWFTILSTVLCIYYGAVNWNKGSEDKVDTKVQEWADLEDKIDEEL